MQRRETRGCRVTRPNQVLDCPSETNTCCSLPPGHGGRPDQRGRTAGALQAAPSPPGQRAQGWRRAHLLLAFQARPGLPPQGSPLCWLLGGARAMPAGSADPQWAVHAQAGRGTCKAVAARSLGMGPAVGCPLHSLGTGPAGCGIGQAGTGPTPGCARPWATHSGPARASVAPTFSYALHAAGREAPQDKVVHHQCAQVMVWASRRNGLIQGTSPLLGSFDLLNMSV